MTGLDIGFGTGYPLIELCQRLGGTSRVYGIDMWRAAHGRARLKTEMFALDNVLLIHGDAGAMPFASDTFDLIVSNLAMNNFTRPAEVFSECHRTAKPKGKVALTTNPRGHMRELYDIFRQALEPYHFDGAAESLERHLAARLEAHTIACMLRDAGFSITAEKESAFYWRFVDGTAFLNHYTIKSCFVPSWQSLIPESKQSRFFEELEERLNAEARETGEFTVTVPMVYIEAEK
jgi:ubiquinone/menaquinone biosynthesis C-methylase UbiE